MVFRRLITILFALAATPVFAASDEIEHDCTTRYPNVTQYFAWRDCVKTETKREEEERFKATLAAEKQARELAERPCIAADISRMEDLAAKARAAIKPQFNLEEAQTALGQAIGYKGEIHIPNDDIKERVLVFSIRTKCNSQFHFLINLRAGQDGSFRWYRTWAQYPPAGYKGELHSEYSIEFEEQRRLEASRAEAAKSAEAFQAMMAKSREDLEEKKRQYLRGIKITNAQLRCEFDCAWRVLEFNVTNESGRPVGEVSFGWMLPREGTGCPSNLASKGSLRRVLQPGETVRHKIQFDREESANSGALYCLRVTEVRAPYDWER